MVAKRIRLGRRTELPLYALGGYVLTGPILWLAGAQDVSSALRAPALIIAVIAFLAGAVIHILDRIDQHDAAMNTKIDESVGDVWDAGAESERQHQALTVDEVVPPLAVVRDLSPR